MSDTNILAYPGVDAAAKACGTRPFHIRQAIKAGKINPRRVGLRSLILKSEVEAWLLSQPAPHKRTPKAGEKIDAS